MDVSRCAPSVLYAYDLGALWVSGWMPGPPGAVAESSNWSFSMTKRTLRLVNKMGTCPGTYLTIAPLVWEVGGV